MIEVLSPIEEHVRNMRRCRQAHEIVEAERFEVIERSPNYEVSSLGRIRNRRSGQIVTTSLNHATGYVGINLPIDGRRRHASLHRLVAEYFLEDYQHSRVVRHIDQDTSNNAANNLEMLLRSCKTTTSWKKGPTNV